LTWTTAAEIDNDYFTLERSYDGVNFETVSEVPGAMNSNSAITYTELDHEIVTGNTYYRLLVTDVNGNTVPATDNVVVLTRGDIVFNVTEVYPVPADQVVNVVFTTDSNTDVKARVYDLAGKLMDVMDVEAQNGANTLSIDISAYAVGSYYVALTNDSQTVRVKFIKD